jgi:hypothetical protein
VEDQRLQTMLADMASSRGLYELAESFEGQNRYEAINPADEWVGMPVFENEEVKPYHSLHLRFKTEQDMNDFAALVQQTITNKTTYLYYPKQDVIDNQLNHVIAHES